MFRCINEGFDRSELRCVVVRIKSRSTSHPAYHSKTQDHFGEKSTLGRHEDIVCYNA